MVPATAVHGTAPARPWPVVQGMEHREVEPGQVLRGDLLRLVLTVIVVTVVGQLRGHHMSPPVRRYTMIAATMSAIHSASVLSMVYSVSLARRYPVSIATRNMMNLNTSPAMVSTPAGRC